MNEEFLAKLEKALDERTKKKLVGYALKIVSRLSWPGELSLGELAQDIVSEAVCKIVKGVRNWSSDVTPELEDFLFSSVRSTIDARVKNSRNKLNLKSLDAPEAPELFSDAERYFTDIEAEELLCALLVELGDDAVCVSVLDLCEKGLKPKEIAKELNLNVKEVYAAKKRLERAATACLQQMKEVTKHAE